MPITESQRQKRRNYVGSSDAAAILGLSPFKRTAADIYWSKVTPPPKDEPPDYMTTGNYLEDTLLRWFADRTGNKIIRNQFRVAKKGRGEGVFGANMDALIEGKREGVECKYANAERAKEYGDEGTDQVPLDVIIQVQHQMYCVGLDKVWVPVALAGYSLNMKLYCVPRDDILIEAIVNKCMDWWEQYVVTKTPPQGAETPPIDFLNTIERAPGAVIQLMEDAVTLAEDFETAKAQEKRWAATVSALRTKIIQGLGDCEIGMLPDGRTVEYKLTSTTRFDQTGFKMDHPDLALQYTKESKYRKLYVKKAKKKGAAKHGKKTEQQATGTAA